MDYRSHKKGSRGGGTGGSAEDACLSFALTCSSAACRGNRSSKIMELLITWFPFTPHHNLVNSGLAYPNPRKESHGSAFEGGLDQSTGPLAVGFYFKEISPRGS